MKLSEYRGEDALDILADILEPSAKILADKKIWTMWQDGKTIEGIKYAIKTYKKEIIEIMARTEDTSAEKYNCNVFTLPVKLMDLINDEVAKDFFMSQFQNMDETSFGTVMETTKGKETE